MYIFLFTRRKIQNLSPIIHIHTHICVEIGEKINKLLSTYIDNTTSERQDMGHS